jgi:hypothetical protein
MLQLRKVGCIPKCWKWNYISFVAAAKCKCNNNSDPILTGKFLPYNQTANDVTHVPLDFTDIENLLMTSTDAMCKSEVCYFVLITFQTSDICVLCFPGAWPALSAVWLQQWDQTKKEVCSSFLVSWFFSNDTFQSSKNMVWHTYPQANWSDYQRTWKNWIQACSVLS